VCITFYEINTYVYVHRCVCAIYISICFCFFAGVFAHVLSGRVHMGLGVYVLCTYVYMYAYVNRCVYIMEGVVFDG
jgi:hypothetical protein